MLHGATLGHAAAAMALCQVDVLGLQSAVSGDTDLCLIRAFRRKRASAAVAGCGDPERRLTLRAFVLRSRERKGVCSLWQSPGVSGPRGRRRASAAPLPRRFPALCTGPGSGGEPGRNRCGYPLTDRPAVDPRTHVDRGGAAEAFRVPSADADRRIYPPGAARCKNSNSASHRRPPSRGRGPRRCLAQSR
jgi:hypothetical protein